MPQSISVYLRMPFSIDHTLERAHHVLRQILKNEFVGAITFTKDIDGLHIMTDTVESLEGETSDLLFLMYDSREMAKMYIVNGQVRDQNIGLGKLSSTGPGDKEPSNFSLHVTYESRNDEDYIKSVVVVGAFLVAVSEYYNLPVWDIEQRYMKREYYSGVELFNLLKCDSSSVDIDDCIRASYKKAIGFR